MQENKTDLKNIEKDLEKKRNFLDASYRGSKRIEKELKNNTLGFTIIQQEIKNNDHMATIYELMGTELEKSYIATGNLISYLLGNSEINDLEFNEALNQLKKTDNIKKLLNQKSENHTDNLIDNLNSILSKIKKKFFSSNNWQPETPYQISLRPL